MRVAQHKVADALNAVAIAEIKRMDYSVRVDDADAVDLDENARIGGLDGDRSRDYRRRQREVRLVQMRDIRFALRGSLVEV